MALGDLVASILSRPSVFVSNHLDVCSRPAADNVDFGNDSRRELDGASSSGSAAGAAAAASTVTPSLVYLPQTVVFCKLRHDGFEDSIPSAPSETDPVSKWRSKDRMKTSSVALVLCLNISVDPSDVIKISPCARMECWIDPFSMAPPKALETIGKTLLAQYEQWQPRARYKYQLDPTMDEVKKLCNAYRKSARSDRVLFHYNGHGVPKPTANGEIWLFNKSYTQYIPLPVSDLDSWLKTPSIYVFDCSAAGMIVSAITEHQDCNSQGSTSASSKDCIILAACEAHETLPQSPEFPGDVFTACLTTPIKMALQWYCTHSLLHDSLKPSDIDKIPGRQNDRKTLLGELNWIFTAVTDTIAWNVLPRDLFQRLFRQDLLVASLFRNFLLAERVMRAANCSPVSFPVLPLTHRHHMWDVWDMAAEICLSQLKSLIYEPNTEFQPSPFFTEQLTAFEVWLDHGSKHKKRPEQLPIVLQVLLSHSHRFHALVLLGRFLDMGSWAVDLALSVGIFPCVLKLLQTTAMELRQILVFIWAKILAFDKSCQVDLVKDGGHIYFIKLLESMDAYPEQRAMAAFVLAVIVNGHRCGQEACIQANLINVCLRHLQLENLHDTQTEPLLVQWLCLCLGKLWEDFPEAQMVGLRADAPAVYAPLLAEHQPEVRASAVFALGTLLDIGSDTYRDGLRSDGDCDDDEKNRTGWNIVKSILKVVSDGSPLVRAEVAVALARFARGHNKHLKSIAETFWKLQSSSLLNSLSSFGNIRCPSSGCTGQYMEPAIAIPSQIVTLLRSAGDRTSAGRDGRVSTSSPLASSGMMYEFPLSDDSSQHSDLGIISKDAANNGFVAFSKLRILDNAMYTECVLAMYTLAKDPSPRVASLGRRVLSIIGIEQVATKTLRSSVIGGSQHRDTTSGSTPSLSGLVRSSSWFDLNAGLFKTSSVSPLQPNQLTGMRRVCSLEFMSHQFNSPDGLADPLLGSGGSSVTSDRSLLPQSTVYHWSCGHFSQPLLTATDDNEGVSVRREEREKFALDCIVKCQHSSVGKLSNEVAVWDTKFEMGTKAALLHPFSPVVIAADDCERIRIWNYEEAMLLNSFDNHDFPNKGISKLCLANELDDSLLLIASSDGNIRVWKDYSLEGKEKLVTAFSSIPGRRPGVQNVHAVVDWQQQSGYLYASGEISSIILWDLDKEQLFSSIPSSSDSSVSVLSASQVHGGQFAAGYADGSVRLFDVRAADMLVCTMRPHNQVERVAGIGFQPGLESSKIVSASQAGDIQFMDIRSHSGAYCTIDAYRGSIAALAIHPHAPIIASGSAKQIIEVFNLEGERLSIICYHPTFMAQKIGPVSCLTFHPYRVLLATGATDPCLSIYTEDGAQSR